MYFLEEWMSIQNFYFWKSIFEKIEKEWSS